MFWTRSKKKDSLAKNRCPHCGEPIDRVAAFFSTRWNPYECWRCHGRSVHAGPGSISAIAMVALPLAVASTDDGLLLLLGLVAVQLAAAFFCQTMKPYERKEKT